MKYVVALMLAMIVAPSVSAQTASYGSYYRPNYYQGYYASYYPVYYPYYAYVAPSSYGYCPSMAEKAPTSAVKSDTLDALLDQLLLERLKSLSTPKAAPKPEAKAPALSPEEVARLRELLKPTR